MQLHDELLLRTARGTVVERGAEPGLHDGRADRARRLVARVARWNEAFRIGVRSGWRRFKWDLHGALGIWLFPFI